MSIITKVEVDKASSQTDATYPLVLAVSVEDSSMSFNFTCRLDVRESLLVKKIEGVIEGRGMASQMSLDDDDADHYQSVAEKTAIEAVKNYLTRAYGREIKGSIKSISRHTMCGNVMDTYMLGQNNGINAGM